MTTGIVEKPLGVDWLRTCPACGMRRALVFTEKRHNELGQELTVYRCKSCGAETEFADRHPPGTI